MSRIGLRLDGPHLQLLSVAALAVALTAIATNHGTPAILTGALSALLIGATLTYRSRTALGWIWHRLTYRHHKHVNNRLYRHKQTGVTWDGTCASAYIEILPEPYEVTTIDSAGHTPQRAIPIDDIRDELTQYDIHCHHITAFTIGYKYDHPSKLAALYHTTLGPIDANLHGRTIIEVSVELANAIDSLAARTGNGSDADGLNNTVLVAAERIRRRISAAGHPAHLLTYADLDDLDTSLRKQLVPALLEEHWASAGTAKMRAISCTPDPSAWTAEHYSQWCKLNPHRQIHAVRLSPGSLGDTAEMYLTLLAPDTAALTGLPSMGLRTEYGQQADILSAYIPSVRTAALTAIPQRTLPPESTFPIPLTPAGIGTYLGHTKTRARVFVNFTTGSTPFYVISPATMCQQLLLRLATSGRSIDIAIDTDQWRHFAHRIGATCATNRAADIVVTADHPNPQQHPGQVRLVWTTTAATLPRRPDYAIVAGPEECALYTPDGVTKYRWSTSTAEEAFFTIGRPPPATTTPRRNQRRQPPPPLPPPTPGQPRSGAHRANPTPRPPTAAPAPATVLPDHLLTLPPRKKKFLSKKKQ